MTEEHHCSPALIRAHEERLGKLENTSDTSASLVSEVRVNIGILNTDASNIKQSVDECACDRRSIKKTIKELGETMENRDRELDRRVNSLAIKVAAAVGLLQVLLVFVSRLLPSP